MDLKSLGWKFLNKETFGDGNLSYLSNFARQWFFPFSINADWCEFNFFF